MKKSQIILTILMITSVLSGLHAQNTKIDSLINLLGQHQNEDTVRVNLLNEIAYELRSVDKDKNLKYAEEAGKLADKLSYTKGKAESLRLTGLYYGTKADYPQALEYCQKSLKIYEKIVDKKGITKCLFDIGLIYWFQSNYPKALEYYQKALKRYEELEDKQNIANVLTNIGLIYRRQSNYLQALEYYQKALKIYEEIGYKKGISNSLNNLGIVNFSQSNYPQATEYYLKALKILEELGDNKRVSNSLNNIGLVFKQQSNYSKALEYFQKTLKISEEIGYKSGISASLNNIGDVNIKQNNYHQALEYLQRAMKIDKESGDKYGLCLSYSTIGEVYLKTNNNSKALNYTLKSLKIADELGLVEDQKNIHEQLSEIYVAIKNYKKAYESYVLYKELNDSIFNEKNIKKITGLEYQYEFDKEKQATELEQQKKDAVLAEEAKRQKTVRNSFIAGFIFMLLLVLVVLRSFLQKRKANRILALQKQKIEDTNEELFQQKEEIQAQSEELIATNNRLQELDKFKEEMTGMIVHDLKNPLNSIIGLAENDNVKQSGKQMLNMIMNILDVHKYEDTEIQLQTTNNSIYEVSELALDQVNLLYEQKNIKLENYIKNDVVAIDKEIIERVFVNILTNAIKYTPNNGTITLESHKNSDDFVRVKISDTGMGIPSDKLNSVFGKFEQLIAKKSGTTRSTGIGLTFCKLFVEAQGGEIGVESELEKGTTFWFTLPAGDLQSLQDLKSLTINEEITEEKPFELSKADKEILKPALSKLQNLVVYESSEIEKIFEQLDFTKTQNLEKWKKEMDNALYVLNPEEYSYLIKMIN